MSYPEHPEQNLWHGFPFQRQAAPNLENPDNRLPLHLPLLIKIIQVDEIFLCQFFQPCTTDFIHGITPWIWFIITGNYHIKPATGKNQCLPMCIITSADQSLNPHMIAKNLHGITACHAVPFPLEENIRPSVVIQLIIRGCADIPCRLFCLFFFLMPEVMYFFQNRKIRFPCKYLLLNTPSLLPSVFFHHPGQPLHRI